VSGKIPLHPSERMKTLSSQLCFGKHICEAGMKAGKE